MQSAIQFRQECGILDSQARFLDRALRLSVQKSNRKSSLRKDLVRVLRPHVNVCDLRSLLSKRMRRWYSGRNVARDPMWMVDRALGVVPTLRAAPPCVIAAVLKTWLNGWCTSRRFQDTGRSCRLCEDCLGEDPMEHYVECMYA